MLRTMPLPLETMIETPLQIFLVITLAACAAPSKLVEIPMPPESNRMHPDNLPTPFSAVQIREAFTPQGTVRMEVHESKKPVRFEVMRITAGSNGTSEGSAWSEDATRKRLGTVETFPVNWKALQSHASFSAKYCKLRRQTITTPLGTFSTLLYEDRNEETNETTRFWFAAEYPGPPISHAKLVGDREVYRSTIVERSR